VLVYLLLAAGAILFVVRYLRNKLLQEAAERERQNHILRQMASIYYSIHLIDMDTGIAGEIYADPAVQSKLDLSKDLPSQMAGILTQLINPSHLARMLSFVDFKTLPERLRDRKAIFEDFLGVHIWIRAAFIVIDRRPDGTPRTVVFRTMDINEDKQKEIKLLLGSTTDGLTGCLNRHACDTDLEKYLTEPLPDNFVFVTMDVNGLKAVNDSLGHGAGDELICGAADTMRAAFAPYGKVYRVGGDEFVALVETDAEHLQALKDDFILLQQSWSGKLVKELRISAGFAPHYELPQLKVFELGKEADKRMYAAKSAFYRSRGVDRRGQQAANLALCALYTKILQVNLTEDTYNIVRMLENEKTAACGFDGKISRWLHDFGTSGQVHPEDLQEYLARTKLAALRDFFLAGGTHWRLSYRRRDGDSFRRVNMEIIPARGYTHQQQEVYLYVKNID